MISNLITKIFGKPSDRTLASARKIVHEVKNLKENMSGLTGPDLQEKTKQFRSQLINGVEESAILPEALAVAAEGARRILGLDAFDTQLLGAVLLCQGHIVQMETGEGKTLSAAMAAYVKSLSGLGSHILTVNDYLAARDAGTMGRFLDALGVRVGCVLTTSELSDRKIAYQADITYGVNSEVAFDYLRDNMVKTKDNISQRDLSFVIVDEADCVLIDEARAPLVISRPTTQETQVYSVVDKVAQNFTAQLTEKGPGDYWVDEKKNEVHISEEGLDKAEKAFAHSGLLSDGGSLYDLHHCGLFHHLMASLRAHSLFHVNIHYIVQNQKVVPLDKFTGRAMPDRVWHGGIHQAVEAKENLAISPEIQPQGSVTIQNFFRLYPKASGMTGTAQTDAAEFNQLYGLDVAVVPPHLPCIRKDLVDQVFLTKEAKIKAIIADVARRHQKKQPVLVGTNSVEMSETISERLQILSIPHQVLNAKNPEKEAEIIERSGMLGMVTVATNMAGRGTDIVLGGTDVSTKEEVISLGGLHVIGTERHDARRIDHQLRGRSGRQGDIGSSCFYVSFEDSLLRAASLGLAQKSLRMVGMDEDEAISSKTVSRQIENAQKYFETRHFDMRKSLLGFDETAHQQRQNIYAWRRDVLMGGNIQDRVCELIKENGGRMEEIHAAANNSAEDEKDFNETLLSIYLGVMDANWKNHLMQLDYLMKNINLRSVAQKNPKHEYNREAFVLFEEMVENIHFDLAKAFFEKYPTWANSGI